MAHVDKVDSVAIAAGRVRTTRWEGLDEVEEALMTVSTGCERRTGRRVIALVLCTTSVGNLLALVVVDNSLTPRGDKALAVGHWFAVLVGGLDR